MKLLFFDLETTGTNPGRNGIHQISGQVVIDGIVKESFDFHVQPNPKAAIEDEALAVAGVTREQIAKFKGQVLFGWVQQRRIRQSILARIFLAEQRQVLWFMVLGKFNGRDGSCDRVSCKQAHGNGEFQVVNGCGNAWRASGW